jgi:hypothetical protein
MCRMRLLLGLWETRQRRRNRNSWSDRSSRDHVQGMRQVLRNRLRKSARRLGILVGTESQKKVERDLGLQHAVEDTRLDCRAL